MKSYTNKTVIINWQSVADNLNERGNAVIQNLLTSQQCQTIINLYPNDKLFRSHIVMERYHFGKGEYKYFSYPLPDLVANIRTHLYPPLADIANSWQQAMGINKIFPKQHSEFIERCHQAGQVRPTPLLIKYRENDYNCLHQDLYGEHVFPLQLAILLAEPTKNFMGGEFIMTEQRPRMQSRPEVVHLKQGDAVVFATHQRPVTGIKGIYRVNHRHGVSRVLSGNRYTLGIIFHDAS